MCPANKFKYQGHFLPIKLKKIKKNFFFFDLSKLECVYMVIILPDRLVKDAFE